MDRVLKPASVCLLRHAATPWNREGRFLGRGDIGIDDAARHEITDAVADLARWAPDRVLVSPALRARQTVAELEHTAALAGVPCEIDADLRELDFGAFEGLTRAELAASDLSAAFDRWLRPEHDFAAAPGGERYAHAAQRAERVLRRARELGGRTLLVSHGYLLKILLASHTAGADPGDVRETHLPNGVPVFLTADAEGPWHRSALAVSVDT
ncbi:histidine phosphatase family protein [Paramicrobacterium agarici]|uniref:phosphoglycerate mutase (2,3-diphosphoglycerate-dependent) n=1 Tax=Paramicrobacterium agarici TaxID=630514 RepID=A0A2A9DYA3_9MICO|nr:histidine phosphatase family protein [Microbacterium agarici]PFG31787.1 putative phosphoglycerate mutase [Microbacterium agarici]